MSKRKENESFEDYKSRRKTEKENTKLYLKGRVVWKSWKWKTYIKQRDGIL